MLRRATLLLCGCVAAAASGSMSSFVTRSGAQLMLDNKPFRFAGANMYWLGLDENVANATTGSKIGYPTDFRIDDGLATAAEMGANVVRAHTLGVSTGNARYSFEGANGTFNDAAAERMDFAIARARQLFLLQKMTCMLVQ